MTDNKLNKLLFELSKNSRITTKELGQSLRISQQSASYSIQNLFKKDLVQNYQTIIDPAKFGLINILVLYDFIDFSDEKIKNLLSILKKNQFATHIELVSQGADLIVEFTVPNLSLFNKQNQDVLHQFKDMIKLKEIHVVIVKHLFEKNYISKFPIAKQIILSGDRDIVPLNIKQRKVLRELRDNGKESILNIARNLNLDSKTVISIKKHLEKEKIIRKYSILLNYEKLNIERSYAFLKLDYNDTDEINKFVEICKQHHNVIEMTKLIGNYELMVVIEKQAHKAVINDLRKAFSISDYKIIHSDSVLKSNFIPDKVFEEE